MTILLILIPAALLLGLIGLVAFMWALRSGQFDDLEGAANRILFDEDEMDLPHKTARQPDAARPGRTDGGQSSCGT